MTKNFLRILSLLFTLMLAACGGGGGSTSGGGTPTPPSTVTKIELDPPSITLRAGESLQLTLNATSSDGYGPVNGSSVTWSPGNTAVATVDSTGTLTAVAVGTTTLTVSYAGLSIYVPVTVKRVVESIYLDATAVTIYGLGSSRKVSLLEKYPDGSTADVTSEAQWSSDNLSVAQALAGTISAVAAGSTTVTASYLGVNYTVAVTVSTQDQLTLAINGTTAQEWLEVAAANPAGADPLVTTYWDYTGNDYDGSATNHMVLEFGKNFDSASNQFASHLMVRIKSWDTSFATGSYNQRQNTQITYRGPEGEFSGDQGEQTRFAIEITKYTTSLGYPVEGTITATLCKSSVLQSGGDCSLAGNFIELAGSFRAAVDATIRYLNEGSQSAPVALVYPFTPHRVEAQESGTSYYTISGLTPGQSYAFVFNDANNPWLRFTTYDGDWATANCIAQSFPRCEIKPTTGTVNLKVGVDINDNGAYGGAATLFIAPLSAEGSALAPKVLSAADALSYAGMADENASYYRVDGLTAGARYTVVNTGEHQHSGIYVYKDAAFSNLFCSHGSEVNANWPSIFCHTTALPTTSLYIKVDHSDLGLMGANFTLNVFETYTSEGTLAAPLVVPLGQDFMGKRAPDTQLADSYYVVEGLTPGSPYLLNITKPITGLEFTLANDANHTSAASCSWGYLSAYNLSEYCLIFPQQDRLWIKAHSTLQEYYGTSYTLKFAPYSLVNLTGNLPTTLAVDSPPTYAILEGLTPGQSYNVTFSNDTVDTTVYIYDQDRKTVLASELYNNNGEPPYLTITPSSSTVYVETSTYYSNHVGEITLESVVPAP
ncbi:MAG TPA: Ig-like domain-containing protein [Gammaproteobacteria bacterium]